MAPSCSKTRSSTLSMKLLVDTAAGRVIYAEAGKDVVDFLFSLLTLPISAVVKILTTNCMVGCIGNLYGSVERLDAAYYVVRSADAKAALLSPAGGYERGSLLRLHAAAAATAPPVAGVEVVYQCSEDDCYNCVAVVKNTPCRYCGGPMNVAVEVVGSSVASGGGGGDEDDVRADQQGEGRGAPAAAGMGFVQGVVTYTVMDDLTVAPMSTISGIAALRGLGVTDISSLQEKSVRVGYNEGLEMLRASLQSKTVLTDVFLGKNMWIEKDAAAPSNDKKKPKATSSQSQKKKQRTSLSKKRK